MKTNGIIVALICMVLFSGVTIPTAAAQDGASRTPFELRVWKSADEVTFAAPIQEIVSKNPVGVPSGLNLLMSGAQAALYVNLGPHPGDAVRRSLSAGQVIQVVGIVRAFNGQNYLLARELQIGEQKIEIRNQHGGLTYPSASTGSRSARTESSKIGGAR